MCTITDLNSANGSLVNGEKITPQVPIQLENNSNVKIGPFDIILEEILKEVQDKPSADTQPKIEVQPEDVSKPSSQTKGLAPESLNQTDSSGQGSNIPPIIKPPSTAINPPPPEKKEEIPPPGLYLYSTRLINYLPEIFQDDFTSRFLALFESILIPIEWNIDNFDLFLDPTTSPADFLPWLMNWFQLSFDSTWREDQKRVMLREANQIYARRGTRWAVTRTLEIYLGKSPVIIEFGEGLSPYTFKVKVPFFKKEVNQDLIEQLININKPAYTAYMLEFLE